MMDDCDNIDKMSLLVTRSAREAAGSIQQQTCCRTTSRTITETSKSGCKRRGAVLRQRTGKLDVILGSTIMILVFDLFICQLASAVMNLPDGIENVLGFVPRSTFQCERDGYFGDIDNDCRIFHLCQRQVHSNGRIEWRHWTYACGNQTMFNQLTLTCAFVDEAIPCKHASQFQYLNEVIHKPAEPFLTDADVTSGFSYYGNRIMSDGARARAFEDSQLMSQIGGNSNYNNQHHDNQVSNFLPSATFASNDISNQQDSTANLDRQSLPASANHPVDDASSSTHRESNGSGGSNFIESRFSSNEDFQSSPVFINAREQFSSFRNQQQQQQQQQQDQTTTTTTQATVQQQPRSLPLQLVQSEPRHQGTGVSANLIENHSIQLEHHTNHQPTQPGGSTPALALAPSQQQRQHHHHHQSIQHQPRASAGPFGQSSSGLAASSPLVTIATTTTTTTPSDQRQQSESSNDFSFQQSGSLNNNRLQQQEQFVQPTTESSISRQQQQQQQLVQTSATNGVQAQSFSFSIATNHQPGAQAELTHHFGPLQVQPMPASQELFHQNQPVTASILTSLASLSPQQPSATTTTTTSSPFTTESSPVTNAPTTLVVPTFATQRLQSQTPPPTTTTTASIATSTPTGGSSPAQNEPRAQLGRRHQQAHQRLTGRQPRQQQQQQQQRASAQRQRVRDLRLERAHSGFHSTRLSPQERQQQQQAGRFSADSALIMRHETQPNTPPTPISTTTTSSSTSNSHNDSGSGSSGANPSALLQSRLAEASDWQPSSDFWRRPFDAQLLNPKFESMLTRKRV